MFRRNFIGYIVHSKRMWKNDIVMCLKLESLTKTKKLSVRIAGPKFEPGMSRIRSRRADH
jgi:hypothetical protein